MPNTPDITIIGGGINGLLTAHQFCVDGANVTLIEKNRLGRESSWAGGGILLPLYPWRQDAAISQLVLQSLKMYPELSQQLHNNTNIDPELSACGLIITHNPDIETAKTWCIASQIPFDTCNSELLGPFNAHCNNPLWLPNIAQARNPRLLKALIKNIVGKVNIIEHCELQDADILNNNIRSIRTSSGTFPVNQLIMTTGAWTGELWQKLFANTGADFPKIFPVKGQMLLFGAKPGLLKHMILDENRYLIPRRDGKILAGSTVENTGFNKQTTPNAQAQLLNFSRKLFPALNNCPLIKHWAGLRPGTEHGIPYIDIHPQIKNLSINAGHFRNGLAMAPASVQLLIDLIKGQPTKIPPDPYQLTASH